MRHGGKPHDVPLLNSNPSVPFCVNPPNLLTWCEHCCREPWFDACERRAVVAIAKFINSIQLQYRNSTGHQHISPRSSPLCAALYFAAIIR